MNYFSNHDVIAFTSDSSIDFTPTDFSAPLTELQQQYLKQHTGHDIAKVIWGKQVHGDGINWGQRPITDADAFVTDQRHVAIAIRTADCVPVFLYDPIKKVIAVVHAGWKGTVERITFKTIELMHALFNCDPKDIQAACGPAGQVCCYEVGPEFKEYFPYDITERNGKLYADVTNANVRQLKEAGILVENIENKKICTICSSEYFSHRRQGLKAGRMISIMMSVGEDLVSSRDLQRN